MSRTKSLIVFGLIAIAGQEGFGQSIYFIEDDGVSSQNIKKINTDGSGLETLVTEGQADAFLSAEYCGIIVTFYFTLEIVHARC